MQSIAVAIDLFAMAFVFGATAWFFFVQAPVLMHKLGREKFVPIQMMLTKALGRVLLGGTALMLAMAFINSGPTSGAVITAAIALFGALVNQSVLIPRALRAGGKGHRTIRGKDNEASTAGFASEGVGDATATLHRLVVLFVVVMLGGLVSHGLLLVGAVA